MSEYDPDRVPVSPPGDIRDRPHQRPIRVDGPKIHLWIVSRELCEVTVHWSGVRNFGCHLVHGSGPCPGCTAGWARVRQWWLTVCRQPRADWPCELLCMTRVAVMSAPELLADAGSLWGRRLTVWRYPEGLRSPMYASVARDESPRDLPDAEPTLHTLIRLWQARTRAETLAKRAGREGRAPSGPDAAPPPS